jgi:undecaprenyl-diphosphatase
VSLLATVQAHDIPVWHAIVLGIVQGFTEFLPISSSGHLILVPWLFGWNELTGPENADFNKTFDVALHLGTFVGIFAYFFKDVMRLTRAGFRSIGRRAISEPDERLVWLLVLSSIPAAIVGATLESVIEDKLGEMWLIAISLIVFGILLFVADRTAGTRPMSEFRFRDAAVMGLCQAAALQPGVSRSGITISGGLFLGFQREAAARLSFLMSLPVIAGASLYSGIELAADGLPPGTAAAFLWGMAASAVTGAVVVWFLLRFLRTHTFTPFVVYRVVVGVAVLIALAAGAPSS